MLLRDRLCRFVLDSGLCYVYFFFSSRRRHTRWPRDWSSDVCSSDLLDTAPLLFSGHGFLVCGRVGGVVAADGRQHLGGVLRGRRSALLRPLRGAVGRKLLGALTGVRLGALGAVGSVRRGAQSPAARRRDVLDRRTAVLLFRARPLLTSHPISSTSRPLLRRGPCRILPASRAASAHARHPVAPFSDARTPG